VASRSLRRSGRLRDRNGHSGLLAEQLTPREREVLGLLSQGAKGSDIATDLSMSPNTVRTHVQSILSKLQVHSRLEAVAFAVNNGIIDVPGRPPNRRA
jgi:two-component system, NarL family, nitrate/nitrite response regulator NarL